METLKAYLLAADHHCFLTLLPGDLLTSCYRGEFLEVVQEECNKGEEVVSVSGTRFFSSGS
jgi:hypothetical protein